MKVIGGAGRSDFGFRNFDFGIIKNLEKSQSIFNPENLFSDGFLFKSEIEIPKRQSPLEPQKNKHS